MSPSLLPQLSRISRGKSPDAYCPIPTLCQDQETWAFDLGGGIFCSSLLCSFLSTKEMWMVLVVRCILFSKIGAEGVMKNRASERRGWGSVLLLRGRRQVEMSPCPFQYQNTSSHFFTIGMGIRCPNSPPAPFQGWLHTFAPSTSWARQEGHALRKNKPSGSAFQLRFYLCSVLFASDPWLLTLLRVRFVEGSFPLHSWHPLGSCLEPGGLEVRYG